MRTTVSLALLALAGCSGPPAPAPFPGYAEAEFVYVAAPTSGTLQALAVQRGATVAKGQPLFTLDTDAEALTAAGAGARRERAAAVESNLRKGRRPLELKAIDEQLAQAQAALAASTATLARNRQLVDQGFVSALSLDTLAAARERDAARVKELEAQRAFASQAARSDELAAAAADLRATQADLDIARWREGQRARTAPAAALVQDTLYQPGEWVPAGAPVVALLPPGALKLRFFVPQAQLAALRVGTTVQVRCDGCAAQTATVRWISPQAEFTPPVIYSNGSRSKLVFMVEAAPADAAALKPGQPVDIVP